MRFWAPQERPGPEALPFDVGAPAPGPPGPVRRYMYTRYLWVQERLAMRHLDLGKIGTRENRADLLTKPLTKKEMEEHMKGIHQEFREGRAQSGLRLL